MSRTKFRAWKVSLVKEMLNTSITYHPWLPYQVLCVCFKGIDYNIGFVWFNDNFRILLMKFLFGWFLYYSESTSCLFRYEFKNNHGEWVKTVKPDLGPGISERVWEALETTDENIDVCHSVKTELRAALTALLGVPSLSLSTFFGANNIEKHELQSYPWPWIWCG